MTNRKEIVNKFYQGETKGKTSSLWIEKANKGSVLYSYATPIAYRDEKGSVYVGDKKYSKSTSAQQNEVLRGGAKKEESDVFRDRLNKAGVYSTGRL